MKPVAPWGKKTAAQRLYQGASSPIRDVNNQFIFNIWLIKYCIHSSEPDPEFLTLKSIVTDIYQFNSYTLKLGVLRTLYSSVHSPLIIGHS